MGAGRASVVDAGLEAAVFLAHLRFRVTPEQGYGDMPQDGEVLGGMVDTYPTPVFAEDHVENPVHRVFSMR